MPRFEQYVLGPDIPVHYPLPMGVGQRLSNVPSDPDRFGYGQLNLPPEPLSERLAADVGHHVEEAGRAGSRRHDAGVIELENMGVVEAGQDPDLAAKPPRVRRGGDFRPEHLERDRPLVPTVLREVYNCGRAPAELALDEIPCGLAGGVRLLLTRLAPGLGVQPLHQRLEVPGGQFPVAPPGPGWCTLVPPVPRLPSRPPRPGPGPGRWPAAHREGPPPPAGA